MGASTHQKSIEYETLVANYYREQGYDQVKLRQRLRGIESDVEHEMDVVVYDDSDNPIIACQCKYKESGKVNKNDIAKWRDKCNDVRVEPHYSSTNFNDSAKKFARNRDVTLISSADLDGLSVTPESVQEWESGVGSLNNQTEKLLYSLYSVRSTGILEDASRAVNNPADELDFHLPKIYELYVNPDTQYGTKFLKAINRIEGEYGPKHAFGSEQDNVMGIQQNIGGGADGFLVPPKVGKVSRTIKSVLERGRLLAVPHFEFENYGQLFEIFLDSWLRISESPINPMDLEMSFYSNYRRYKEKQGVTQVGEFVIEIDEAQLPGDLREIDIEPQVEFWQEYLGRIDNISAANRLFRADIEKIEPYKYHPIFAFGASETTPLLDIFKTAEVVSQAKENNEVMIENYLSELHQIPIE